MIMQQGRFSETSCE